MGRYSKVTRDFAGQCRIFKVSVIVQYSYLRLLDYSAVTVLRSTVTRAFVIRCSTVYSILRCSTVTGLRALTRDVTTQSRIDTCAITVRLTYKSRCRNV